MELLKVFAFVGNEVVSARGNICRLYAYGEEPDSVETDDEATCCHSWFDRYQQSYTVECFNNGKRIACCGHGLLSAAYYWMRKRNVGEINLQMNTSQIQAHFANDEIWLRFPRISCTRCVLPEWLAGLIGNNQTLAAATAGGDSGYLVLQWPDGYPLESLPNPGETLGDFTQRAVIYTAKQTLNDQPEFFMHFRYFAPQYDVDEDMATGSAMRILMDYWSEPLEKQTIVTALQVSSEKGFLRGRVYDNTVEVGGSCLPIREDVG